MTPKTEIGNAEIFIWALHQLGGSQRFIDVEEVSLECFRLAPARFSWRTRSDLPDYKKCSKALQEVEARFPGIFIKSGDSNSRQLSLEGQKWVEENTKRLSKYFSTGKRIPSPSRRPTSKMLLEIEQSEAYLQWKETGDLPKEKWRMADVLRCSPDSSAKIWKDRLQSARAIAYSAESESIVQFLNAVAVTNAEWFGGKT